MRDGQYDTTTNSASTGKDIIGQLMQKDRVLLPEVISPHGRWGIMFHYHLFGALRGKHYKFLKKRSNPEKMYRRAMSYPAPVGIITLATSTWKKEKP